MYLLVCCNGLTGRFDNCHCVKAGKRGIYCLHRLKNHREILMDMMPTNPPRWALLNALATSRAIHCGVNHQNPTSGICCLHLPHAEAVTVEKRRRKCLQSREHSQTVLTLFTNLEPISTVCKNWKHGYHLSTQAFTKYIGLLLTFMLIGLLLMLDCMLMFHR